MDKLSSVLQAAYAAFQRGELAQARRLLKKITHPKALHLLALVEKADGDLQKSLQLLQRASAKDSRDPEIANNLASVAQDLGQLDLAETEYRRALQMRPDFLPAALALGRLLTDLERYQSAFDVYQNISVTASNDVFVRYGLGTTLLGLGQAEKAESIFNQLIEEDDSRSQFRFMRGRCRLELGKTTTALQDLKVSHAASPNTLSLKALANTYWMMRDETAFDGLINAALEDPLLATTAAEVLRQSGAPERSLAAINDASAKFSLPAESWAVAASAYIDLNEGPNAEMLAREAIKSLQSDPLANRNLIVSLLMQGKADEAMPLIEERRREQPNDQQWIAYEASALRLLGSERYAQLVDLDRFVRPFTLPIPEGFDSIESFNAAFLESLKFLHSDQTHPLNQSLRDGSQTPRDLTTINDPVIQAFYKALDEPIRQYMSEVGAADDHPLTRRNTGEYRIAGGWSVKLHGSGRHVNHVHPEGWISSSYYVSVPEETKTDSNKAGWIKFAEPPFATSPPSLAEKWVRPEAGMLVLFPSFLWHGTQPIYDDSVRVTAPFDAVPV